jgi:flagellin
MGLRVNANVASLRILENLRNVDTRRNALFEQLSTGYKINKAKDDPFGLVLSENLRSQIRSLNVSVENNTSSANMFRTADAALQEVEDLLVDIRANIVSAMNANALGPEAVAAEQTAVDAAITSIQNIGLTTRFNGRHLLNGQSSLEVLNFDQTGILRISPRAARLNPIGNSSDFRLEVGQIAEQAQFQIGAGALPTDLAVSGGNVELRVSGELGFVDLNLSSGTTVAELTQTINNFRSATGVYAGTDGVMRSEEFGSAVEISLTHIGGSGNFLGGDPASLGLSAGQNIIGEGVDAEAQINGNQARGLGNRLIFNSTSFNGTIELNPVTNEDAANISSGSGVYSFSLSHTGVRLQLGIDVDTREQRIASIPNLDPGALGLAEVELGGLGIGGPLDSILSGGVNDLFADPDNASRIVDQVINEISEMRASLGTLVGGTLEPTVRTHEVALENISASESAIRDLDFAEATAALTRENVLFEASLSVMSQANLIPQSVLSILTGR